MYEHFYGLREAPFDLTPNPRYLLLTPRHNEAFNTLRYGIGARKGIVLLLGDAGTGKSTLLRAAIESRTEPELVVSLNNPTLTHGEFLELLADGFGFEEPARHSKARFLLDLTSLLEERQAAGAATILLVDEAQCLSDGLLDEIRLLANIETNSQKLLSIVLAGQPELGARLDAPHLRQLKQRIALRCALATLDLRETASYIAGRIKVAGGEAARLFTRAAVQLIYEISHGIPRTINVVCDNALITGFAVDERPVTRSIIEEVCRDLDLTIRGIPEAKGPAVPTFSAQRTGQFSRSNQAAAPAVVGTEVDPHTRTLSAVSGAGRVLFL